MTTDSRALVGLVGRGLGLSLSPALHEQEGRELGFDYRYEVFDADTNEEFANLPAVLAEMSQRGFFGTNITHPFKQEVMAHLDHIDSVALIVGAVNTVVFDGTRTIGYNTDSEGFLGSLRRNFADQDTGVVTQIGTGGAGSAVAYALMRFGVGTLNVVDLDYSRAAELADRLQGSVPGSEIVAHGIDNLDRLIMGSAGIVNATPIGMHTHPGLPVPRHLVSPERWVHDVIYTPLVTDLVRVAGEVGAPRVAGGGDMVVIQAREAIKLFTGREPDVERMLAHFQQLVDSGAQERLAAHP
jgi:shikimate dehydrogenase